MTKKISGTVNIKKPSSIEGEIRRGYQPTESSGGTKNMPVKTQTNGNISQSK